MSNLYWGILPSLLGYISMIGHSFVIDSLYNLSKRNILIAMFAHQSLFIANTYLYQSTNEFTTLFILIGVWVLAIGLRIIESRYRSTMNQSTEMENIE